MKEYKRYAEQEEDLRIVKSEDGWCEIVNKKGDK